MKDINKALLKVKTEGEYTNNLSFYENWINGHKNE